MRKASVRSDNVYLYNLDDLQQVVIASHNQRSQAVDAAQAIVKQHLTEFVSGVRAREIGPTIDALYKRYHALAQDEGKPSGRQVELRRQRAIALR